LSLSRRGEKPGTHGVVSKHYQTWAAFGIVYDCGLAGCRPPPRAERSKYHDSAGVVDQELGQLNTPYVTQSVQQGAEEHWPVSIASTALYPPCAVLVRAPMIANESLVLVGEVAMGTFDEGKIVFQLVVTPLARFAILIAATTEELVVERQLIVSTEYGRTQKQLFVGSYEKFAVKYSPANATPVAWADASVGRLPIGSGYPETTL